MSWTENRTRIYTPQATPSYMDVRTPDPSLPPKVDEDEKGKLDEKDSPEEISPTGDSDESESFNSDDDEIIHPDV